MPKRATTQKTSKAQIEELQRRLEEAEETLRAIREGQVDALVIAGTQGDQVYTLKGADHAFRVAVETMNEGAVTLSAQGLILYCNRRFAEMVALPLEQVQGAPLREFIAPAEMPLVNALLVQALAGSAKGETRLCAAIGKQIPVYLSLATLGFDAIPSVTMIVTDLTEQKRTEEIMALERLARAIIDQAAEAIVVCDAVGYVIRASEVAIQLCGQNPLLKRFEEVFPLDSEPVANSDKSIGLSHTLVGRVLNGEPLRNLEAELVRADGQRVSLMVSARPLQDAENRMIGCTIALTDITERRRTELEIRRLNRDLEARTREYENANQELAVANQEISTINEELQTANQELATANDQLRGAMEERRYVEQELAEATRRAEHNRLILEAVIEQMPAGIIVTDATGAQAKNNQAMDRIWKRNMLPNENIDRHDYVALHPDGSEYRPEEWPLTRSLKQGEAVLGEEMTILRGDGTKGTALVSSSPIRDESGEIIAGVVVDTDITELREATEALLEGEARLRQLADASFEGLVVHADGLLLDVNARVTDMLGYDPAKLIGKPMLDYIDPKYHERVIESVRQDRSDPYEVELIHLNGTRVPIEVMGRPIVWKGRPARVAALRDMTARKRAEEELRKSEQRANDLVRYAPTAIYEIDFRGPRFKSVNDAMCQMSGYTREELLAMSPFDLLDPASQALFQDRIRDVLAGRPVDEAVEYRVKTKYNQDRDGLLNISMVYEDGKPVGAFVIAHDITERKQAEASLHGLAQALAHRVAELQTIMEVAPVGICIGEDPASRIITANQTLSEWLAAPEAANISLSAPEEERQVDYQVFREGHPMPPEELPVQYATLNGRSLRNQELRVVRADGICMDLLANAEPLRDEQKRVRGAVATFMDITERKHAEAEREELLRREQAARAAADAAVQLRNQFITVASHELRTPLTGIRGYAELLVQRGERAGLDPQFQRMAETIQRQAGRLEKLIAAMLDVSRIERSQLSLEFGRVDLQELAACVVRDAQSAVREHQIEFISTGSPVFIEGDEARLEQVLQNLVQNAVKYSPLGGLVTVQLRMEQSRAYLSVTDCGIGIPAAAQARLFTQFYRAANAEAHHISGLGVGLYVSREIVRLHGGDIEVQSEEGKGSTFTVTLPQTRNVVIP